MLRQIKDTQQVKEVSDFIYKYGGDDELASYRRHPSYDDIESHVNYHIEDEFGIVFGFYKEEKLIAVLFYSWEEENLYGQADAFIIIEDYDEVANTFVRQIESHLPDYEFICGFSGYNVNARKFFEMSEWNKIEDSHNFILQFSDYQFIEQDLKFKRIDERSFSDYYEFHDKHAKERGMYWDSNKLEKALDKFMIFTNNEITASIFVRYNDEVSVIYGLFVDPSLKNTSIERDLTVYALNYIVANHPTITLIQRFVDSERKDLIELYKRHNFELDDVYIGYKKVL